MDSKEPTSRVQPELNFDVLRSICHQLTDVPDVLSFALTCSALSESAFQRRLSMAPVVLSGPRSVEMFHRFVFADPTSRAPYLYGLTLSPRSDYTPNGDLRFQNYLIAILEAAVHLEYLDFRTTIGHRVCSLVAKMTTLRELALLSDASLPHPHEPEALYSLLTTSRSPLRHLYVGDYEMGLVSANVLHNRLSHFAPTLESLALEEFSFDVFSSSITTSFTAMRSLKISSVSYRLHSYQLVILLRLFPNLDGTLVLEGFGGPDDQYPTLRQRNIEAQKDHACQWAGLDRVVYNVKLAFVMAIRCPIRHMEIDDPLVREEASYMTEVLRSNCPRHLSLPMRFISHDDLRSLHRLFPLEAADTLTHLVLFADLAVDLSRQPTGESNRFWNQFMDGLVGSLKYLRLTHLRVVFYYSVLSPGAGPPPVESNAASDSEGSDFLQHVVQDADLYPAAIRLLDTMETLQYVLLTTCGARQYGAGTGTPGKYWYSSRAWRVASVDEHLPGPGSQDTQAGTKRCSGSCVEIDDEAAEMVIEEEELYMGRRGENMVWHCRENASPSESELISRVPRRTIGRVPFFPHRHEEGDHNRPRRRIVYL